MTDVRDARAADDADTHGINRAVATVGGLLLAMVLHGIYDFFVIRTTLWTHIVPPLLILVIWLTRTWLIARHGNQGHGTGQ